MIADSKAGKDRTSIRTRSRLRFTVWSDVLGKRGAWPSG